MFDYRNIEPRPTTCGPGGPMRALTAALLTAALAVPGAWAGTVDSGSDGSDGVLSLSNFEAITIVVKPGDPPPGKTAKDGYLGDPDQDGVYHYSNVDIGENITLKFSSEFLGSQPIVWKVQGDVDIDGILDFDGEQSNDWDEPATTAHGGAGGYNGGKGGRDSGAGTNGSGPGAGIYNFNGYDSGSGAGHAANGEGNANSAYGNAYLLPLVGGSGGGGGYRPGGGGGGGAIMIVSNTKVTINGKVTAKGGAEGYGNSSSYYWGGGGSG